MSDNGNIDSILHNFNDLMEVLDFLKIPSAEALIPLNPKRLPAHIAGSILGQDLQNADSLIAKPFNNLKVSKEYLTTAHNRSHFYSRAREVAQDTIRVNACGEWGEIGTAGSGVYANWAANKYELKMESDDNRLPSNSTVFTDRRKRKISHNVQQREKATIKVLTKANPPIGNAPMSPTVSQFERASRPLWSMKWFRGGGGNHNTYVIEIPTNQIDLHNKQEEINFRYGDYIFTIILIFVILTKKTISRFRRIKKKLADIFSKVKTKFKRKTKFT